MVDMRRLRGRGVSLADHKRYAKVGTDLNTKLMSKMLRREDIVGAARMLGVNVRGDEVEIYADMELACIMDFALHDVKDGVGRSKVQAYLEDVGPATDLEREILDTYVRSKTSLFRVEECDPRRRTVRLSDQLRRGGEDVTVHDGDLSEEPDEGMSVFARICRGPKFCTTSGISFTFAEGSAPMLIRRYRAMRAKPNKRGPASRFVLFFRMNRKCGLQLLSP